MKITKSITACCFLLLITTSIQAQVGIGTITPNTSAQLDVNSTTKGFLPPRMTRVQRELISTPAAGLVVWCSNCGASGELQVYNGTSWTNMMGGAASTSLPVVTTTAISSITFSGASGGGNITDNGGAAITTRGVVWSTSPNPTSALMTKTTDGTGVGTFTSSIGSLSPATVYYIRAYATNTTGTSYGSELTFTTLGIGSNYGGGKVAYIFQSGDLGFVAGETHGMIASNDEWTTRWGCNAVTLPGANGTGIGAGAQNTIDIVGGCAELGIAARVCDDYSIISGGVTYSDWHLPSITELQKILANRSVIGGFNSPYILYWSSSQNGSTFAYCVRTDNPGQNYVTNKSGGDYGIGTRAVRFF